MDRSIDDTCIYVFAGLEPKNESKFYRKPENERKHILVKEHFVI